MESFDEPLIIFPNRSPGFVATCCMYCKRPVFAIEMTTQLRLSPPIAAEKPENFLLAWMIGGKLGLAVLCYQDFVA